MSDIGTIKPLIQAVPIRPVNKDPAKKKQGKKKKGKILAELEKDSSKKHVNEYI